MKYRVDSSVQVLDDKQVMGGSPLRIFRLTPAGRKVFERLQAGEDMARNSLIDRLTDGGALHPSPTELGPFTTDDVTVVVPAYGSVAVPDFAPQMIVVDDASPTGRPTAPAHASVVRRSVNGGPGAARMTGLDSVTTPLVAFVDADVTLTADWLHGLLPHFADDRVVLVAPRVRPLLETAAAEPNDADVGSRLAAGIVGHARSLLLRSLVPKSRRNRDFGAAEALHESRTAVATSKTSLIERVLGPAVEAFEQDRSPHDLGPESARVRARTRISYVPSAAIVVRVDALRAVGGFDPDLRTGEDVDLVWRLDQAGYIVRYEPAVVVHHAVRPSVGRWVSQRVGYGQSAGPLADRHPGALAPLGISGWSAGVWALLAAGLPVPALGVAGYTAWALRKKLPDLPARTAYDLVRYGHLGAGRQIASAMTRAWWPLAIIAALLSKRARRAVIAAALLPAVSDWYKKRPPIDVARYTALRLLDDGAYGLGLWQSVMSTRNLEPLQPDFTSWPKPSRFEQRR